MKLSYVDTDLSKGECFGGSSPFGDWCNSRAVFSISKAM